MTFKEFNDFVKSTPQEKLEYHLKDQNELLRIGLFGKKPSFIGKVENIKNDWKKICEKLNVNWELLQLHSSKKK